MYGYIRTQSNGINLQHLAREQFITYLRHNT